MDIFSLFPRVFQTFFSHSHVMLYANMLYIERRKKVKQLLWTVNWEHFGSARRKKLWREKLLGLLVLEQTKVIHHRNQLWPQEQNNN